MDCVCLLCFFVVRKEKWTNTGRKRQGIWGETNSLFERPVKTEITGGLKVLERFIGESIYIWLTDLPRYNAAFGIGPRMRFLQPLTIFLVLFSYHVLIFGQILLVLVHSFKKSDYFPDWAASQTSQRFCWRPQQVHKSVQWENVHGRTE